MPNLKYKYIAVEGIIGTGKTSFAELLCREFDGRAVLEEFAENPFLPLFYENPEKYGFTVEMSFLAERYSQLKGELNSADLFVPAVSDYIFEKSLLFAKINLTEAEYRLFAKMFSIIMPQLPQPDIIVYLYKEPRAAKEQILSRGRPYERDIEISYLESLQKAYISLFTQHPDRKTLFVDTTDLDFVNRKSDFDYLKQLLYEDYGKGITRIIPGKG